MDPFDEEPLVFEIFVFFCVPDNFQWIGEKNMKFIFGKSQLGDSYEIFSRKTFKIG